MEKQTIHFSPMTYRYPLGLMGSVWVVWSSSPFDSKGQDHQSLYGPVRRVPSADYIQVSPLICTISMQYTTASAYHVLNELRNGSYRREETRHHMVLHYETT